HENLQAIVVNDGSRDNTVEVLGRIDDRRLVVVSKNNGGISAARNTGVEHAAGRWLAFLDDDDRWLPRKLEMQVDFMRRNKSTPSVTDFFVQNDKSPAYLRRNSALSTPHWLVTTGSAMCMGSSMLVQRDVFKQVGGFDTTTKRTEDWDWLLRFDRKFPN